MITMGVMDKFLNYMKLNDDDDDEFYDDDFLDDDEVETPVTRKAPVVKSMDPVSNAEEEKFARKAPQTKVTPIRPAMTKKVSGNGMEVCLIRPTSMEDAREITETLKANRTVVLNLEGIEVDVAQRILDFTSGSCFAINGNLNKISHYIFIVTPESVDLSGDFQDLFTGAFGGPLNADL